MNRLIDALILAEDAIRAARRIAEELVFRDPLPPEILNAEGDVPADYNAEGATNAETDDD